LKLPKRARRLDFSARFDYDSWGKKREHNALLRRSIYETET
jgi:hypothetical protein